MKQVTPEKKILNHHQMVRWYDPILLIRIALRTLIATVVGHIVDNREIQAALSPVKDDELCGSYDFSQYSDKNDYWLDYVADIGDGWDSTYAVAAQLAKSSLNIKNLPEHLPRGQILIMGGDEIYPDPSMQGYFERTIAPYSLASKNAGLDQEIAKPSLFAIPGNHDWYDGLHAFNNVFCQARGHASDVDACTFASWKTCQKRSYFCIKLPHDWWLCGVDIQLGKGANTTQIDYFRKIAETQMKTGDRIILCCPTPEWLHAEISETGMMQSFTEIMPVLSVTGAKVRMVLAGDVHHYSRFQSEANGMQFVTAGGGGAFMHPTHKLPKLLGSNDNQKKMPKLDLKAHYPDKKISFKLSHKLFLFPFLNFDFALVIGFVYTLLAWIFEAETYVSGDTLSANFTHWILTGTSITDGLFTFLKAVPKSPAFALIVLALYVSFIKFNFTKNKVLGIGLGLAHAMAHFIPFLLAYFIATYSVTLVSNSHVLDGLFPFLVFISIMFVLSSFLGGFVFGLYLWVALNIFGLQWTNSFSALRICNYRNFVRIRLNPSGDLTVYPLRIDDISKQPNKVELIEEPFTVK